jgi:hypothetical protein
MKKPDYDKIINYDKGFLNHNKIIREYLKYLYSELSPKEITHMIKLRPFLLSNKCTSRLLVIIIIVEENRVNIFQDLGKYTKKFIDILPPYQQEAYTDYAIDQRNRHLQTKLYENFDTFKPVVTQFPNSSQPVI